MIAIGWYAQAAIQRIEAKAQDAVDQVKDAIAEVRLAEVTHEAKDDQRDGDLDRRLDHVEGRQDGVERSLAHLGVQSAINEDRRPRLRTPQ